MTGGRMRGMIEHDFRNSLGARIEQIAPPRGDNDIDRDDRVMCPGNNRRRGFIPMARTTARSVRMTAATRQRYRYAKVIPRHCYRRLYRRSVADRVSLFPLRARLEIFGRSIATDVEYLLYQLRQHHVWHGACL